MCRFVDRVEDSDASGDVTNGYVQAWITAVPPMHSVSLDVV